MLRLRARQRLFLNRVRASPVDKVYCIPFGYEGSNVVWTGSLEKFCVYPRCFAQHLNRPPLEMDEPALTHVQIKIGKIQTARYVEVHYP